MTTLLDIWLAQKDFFKAKSVEQLISIAGDGSLRDGNEASFQLRQLLANLPAESIEQYVEECLTHSFQQSGLVLQDLANEIGRRLGFAVEFGYYRGGSQRIGFDGIWKAKDAHDFVVEVKTTDVYQLNLDTIAQYRQKLVSESRIHRDSSSIILIVGRRDTGGLEAQTRGSRHAWDIRIISFDALLKLMRVKESLTDTGTTDTGTVAQIQQVLKPLEYTCVDRLIDIIFRTSEDLKTEDLEEESRSEQVNTEERTETTAKPAQYHEECIARISSRLQAPLIRQGRCNYTNADQTIRVLCIVSKEYERTGAIRYWYAFHPTQRDFLNEGQTSFVALGCGSAENIVLMPFGEFQKHLPMMRTTESDNRYYWHVEVFRRGQQFLLLKPTSEGIDVTQYRIT